MIIVLIVVALLLAVIVATLWPIIRYWFTGDINLGYWPDDEDWSWAYDDEGDEA